MYLLFVGPSKREVNMPIIWTKQGFEPPLFTGFFNEWDTEMWTVRF